MRRRSGYGWFELIIGIMLVVLGIFTFIRPGSTLTGIVILYGLVAVITGISDLIVLCEDRKIYGLRPGGVPDLRNIQHHGRRHAAGVSGSGPVGHGAAASPLVYRALRVAADTSALYPQYGRRILLLVRPDCEYYRYCPGES